MELYKTILMVAGGVYLVLIGLTLFGLLVSVLLTWAKMISNVWKKEG